MSPLSPSAIGEESIASFPNEPPKVGSQKATILDNEYLIWCGTPISRQSETMIPLAWRTHQEGYMREGLAKPAAITPEGYLNEAIDKSRHIMEGISYVFAQRPDENSDRATARLIEADTYAQLPTFGLVKPGMSKEAVNALQEIQEEGIKLVELGALSKTSTRTSRGVQEVIRTLLRATVSGEERDPVRLYCSMVEPARRGLARSISQANLAPIGRTVILEENEFRNQTPLTPLIINPDEFIVNILKAHKKAEDPREGRLTLNSLLFFAHGLDEKHLPGEVSEFMANLDLDTMQKVAS